jgi:hypothetical protein
LSLKQLSCRFRQIVRHILMWLRLCPGRFSGAAGKGRRKAISAGVIVRQLAVRFDVAQPHKALGRGSKDNG